MKNVADASLLKSRPAHGDSGGRLERYVTENHPDWHDKFERNTYDYRAGLNKALINRIYPRRYAFLSLYLFLAAGWLTGDWLGWTIGAGLVVFINAFWLISRGRLERNLKLMGTEARENIMNHESPVVEPDLIVKGGRFEADQTAKELAENALTYCIQGIGYSQDVAKAKRGEHLQLTGLVSLFYSGVLIVFSIAWYFIADYFNWGNPEFPNLTDMLGTSCLGLLISELVLPATERNKAIAQLPGLAHDYIFYRDLANCLGLLPYEKRHELDRRMLLEIAKVSEFRSVKADSLALL